VSQPADLPPHLQARYGLLPVSRTRRALTWVAIVAAAIAATAWVNHANTPSASGRIISFTTLADHVTVRFETSRPSGHGSVCVLRAQDLASSDVGYATVVIPAGASTVQLDYKLRTLSLANLVELLGCTIEGTAPHVAGPAFAPGIQPPIQPWTP